MLQKEYSIPDYDEKAVISPISVEYSYQPDSINTYFQFHFEKDTKKVLGVLIYYPIRSNTSEFSFNIPMEQPYEYKNVDGYTFTLSNYSSQKADYSNEAPKAVPTTAAIISIGEYCYILNFENHSQPEIEKILDSVDVQQLEKYSDIVCKTRKENYYNTMQEALMDNGISEIDLTALENLSKPQQKICYKESNLLDDIPLQHYSGTYHTENGINFNITATFAKDKTNTFCYSSNAFHTDSLNYYTNANTIGFHIIEDDTGITAALFDKNKTIKIFFQNCTLQQAILDLIGGTSVSN